MVAALSSSLWQKVCAVAGIRTHRDEDALLLNQGEDSGPGVTVEEDSWRATSIVNSSLGGVVDARNVPGYCFLCAAAHWPSIVFLTESLRFEFSRIMGS